MLSRRDYLLLALGWDAAVEQMVFEDGTPIEVTNNVNPFRELVEANDREAQSSEED